MHPTGGTVLFGLLDIDGFGCVMMEDGFQSLKDCYVDRFSGIYSAIDQQPICEGDHIKIKGAVYGAHYDSLKWQLRDVEGETEKDVEFFRAITGRIVGSWHNEANPKL